VLFTAACTFLLIVAGALVTSNDAGLSVPDWPTSFHHWPVTPSYFEVPMVGGVKFEHGHRILAQFIGVLTIGLAIWIWRADRRRWMRRLGWFALGLVIAQGVLGGLTVLFFLPRAVSTAHATLSQTFFAVLIAMAVFTGRRFVEPEQEPRTEFIPRRPTLHTLTALSIAVVYVQLVLGAAFRHAHGPRTLHELVPHLVGAAVVTLVLLWTITRVLSDYSTVDQLRAPAVSLLALLMVQLALGFATYLTVVEWGRDAPQPLLNMVLTSVAHVAVGALVLAHTVILAIQAWRHVAIPRLDPVPTGAHKVVHA
jgi:cytochrome c oxidase assembly protein subunit 15